MSTAAKAIIKTFEEIKCQFEICAKMIDECVEQGNLK